MNDINAIKREADGTVIKAINLTTDPTNREQLQARMIEHTRKGEKNVCIDIRLWKSDSTYTGPTKAGFHIPIEKFSKFKKALLEILNELDNTIQLEEQNESS